MGEAVLRDGIAQGADDMLLAEHVGKGFGAILAGEYLITHVLKLACVAGEANRFW
ncbi:hypothetical protein GCM10023213_47490 [Prosthecobacter algae]|uniref:Uncharacterized protein n=1 Tax=Prosthecobacter algae TaxID=1144682 RepID=A0ABP9PV47_9BACT